MERGVNAFDGVEAAERRSEAGERIERKTVYVSYFHQMNIERITLGCHETLHDERQRVDGNVSCS